jgi:hypothetical protein
LKRYLTAFLLAYSLSITLLAAWLAARAFVYWQVTILGSGVGASPTHEQVLANIGAPRLLRGPANETAMVVAALDPVNIAAATFLILITCLGFASRRGQMPKKPDLKKD